MLTAERLRSLMRYEPDTGLFFWKNHSVPAGCFDGHGYRVICVDGRLHRAHRLAWLYRHGKMPNGDIDHIDGDRCNNRIANLRDVCRSRNLLNRHSPRPENRLGIIGVRKKRSKYEARIQFRGKRIALGTYATPEQASRAVEDARTKLIGGQR
jgi:hypothetical protein